MITEKEIEEAQELLKDGYINMGLWRRLLMTEKVYLMGEAYKLRQALKKLESEANELPPV